MTTVETDNARRVCESHVAELERFDEWAETFGVGTSRTAIEDYAEEDSDVDNDTREMASRCLAWMDDNGADDLSWLVFVNGALDVEVTGRLAVGVWEVTEVALLVSFGGPTVRFVARDEDTVCVEVSWWGDRASSVMRCGLACELWDIALERAEAVAG